METGFANKQIVWAKVKGYPWWPAEISKLPTPDSNFFKVVFIAEDTHAFLNPKDVRKYLHYHDECSKKKMRGLAPAIQAADQLHKKRSDSFHNNNSQVASDPLPKKSKTRTSTKNKPIRKYHRRVQQDSQNQSEEENQSEVPSEQKISALQPEVEIQNSLVKEESELQNSQENVQDQKFLQQSDQKVDRNKIDALEQGLLKIIQKIKDNSYVFAERDFTALEALSGDELLLGKITNILNYIITKLSKPSETNDTRWLGRLKQQLKTRIINHLYDTNYYDQYIKLIQKNKKHRDQYQNKLTCHLKSQYRLKKELALIFANRLMTQINNGTISKEKELFDDIKERRLEIINVNNKAAIQRCIEHLIPKYM